MDIVVVAAAVAMVEVVVMAVVTGTVVFCHSTLCCLLASSLHSFRAKQKRLR